MLKTIIIISLGSSNRAEISARAETQPGLEIFVMLSLAVFYYDFSDCANQAKKPSRVKNSSCNRPLKVAFLTQYVHVVETINSYHTSLKGNEPWAKICLKDCYLQNSGRAS